MPPNNLRRTVEGLSKGKRIRAVVAEVLNGKVSVRMGGDGSRLLRGLDLIGGPVVIGQQVFVDYSSGSPIVNATDGTSSRTVVATTKTRSVSVDPDASVSSVTQSTFHTHTLSQISDYDANALKIHEKVIDEITSADDGKIPYYDFGTDTIKWENPPSGTGGGTLSDLSDVVVGTPTDNQALSWDSATSKWIPQTIAAASGHEIDDDLTPMTTRGKLSFVGSGVAVTDDSINGATVVTIDLGDAITTQNLTSQVHGAANHYTVSSEIRANTIRVYVNGIREPSSIISSIDGNYLGFTLSEALVSGDRLVVDYNEIGRGGSVPAGGGGMLDPLSPFQGTVPSLSSLAWDNRSGSVAVEAASGGIRISHAADSDNEIYVLYKNLNYTINYRVTMCMIPTIYNAFNNAGLCIRDSSNSHIYTCGILGFYDQVHVEAQRFLSATTSWENQREILVSSGSPNWFQLEDDGTDRIYRFSYDGTFFTEFFRVLRDDGEADCDGVGFFIGVQNDSCPDVSMWVRSWLEEYIAP